MFWSLPLGWVGGGGFERRIDCVCIGRFRCAIQSEKFESRPATFPEIRYSCITKRIKVSLMFWWLRELIKKGQKYQILLAHQSQVPGVYRSFGVLIVFRGFAFLSFSLDILDHLTQHFFGQQLWSLSICEGHAILPRGGWIYLIKEINEKWVRCF